MENHDNDSTSPKKLHGFAAWSKEKLREVASKGGRRAHEMGTGHEFQMGSPEASKAGRRGGLAIAAKKRRLKETAELKTFVEIDETTPR